MQKQRAQHAHMFAADAALRALYLLLASLSLLRICTADDVHSTPELSTALPAVTNYSVYSIPWLISERVRLLEEEQDFLQQRLAALPPYSTQASIRAGFHSTLVASSNQAQWIQVDLGREYAISTIALVPAAVQRGNAIAAGYGFPVRFRVQLSNDPNFRDSFLAADYTRADYPNPGRYPCRITDFDRSARYVRITVTENAIDSGRSFFALGELIVLCGQRNVAAWRPVTSSGEFEAEDRWSREYLVDQNSMLPLPMSIFASRTEGYVSAPENDSQTRKWVQIDLGEPFSIDEIRLVPARPRGQADVPGWGFPESFKVEVAGTDDFSDSVAFCDFTGVELHHWTDQPMILPAEIREALTVPGADKLWHEKPQGFPAEPVTARFVRITATKLDQRITPARLALAEVQVYSGNDNVALDTTVTALDQSADEDRRRWSLEALVDDSTSRTRLLEFPVWLDQLENRRQMEEKLSGLTTDLDYEVTQVWIRVGSVTAGIAFICIGGLSWFNLRQGRRNRLETENLRTQIASDLHDDIGSNLGAIALLCQTIGNRRDIPEVLQPELEDMRTVALETSDAMRDILWLIRTPHSRLDEFIGRLRSTVARLLPHCETVFTCPDDLPDETVTLTWRRNVFLSCKETLHNAARHSQASRVEVTVAVNPEELVLTIQDDGVGFDFENRRQGLGISSIGKRMKQLGGSVEYATTPESGTSVTFSIPFTRSRYALARLRRYVQRHWTNRRSAANENPTLESATRTKSE